MLALQSAFKSLPMSVLQEVISKACSHITRSRVACCMLPGGFQAKSSFAIDKMETCT